MVGHLHLQGMEDSPTERGREGLLDSPDSGLPPSPSPSPPFYSLEPGLLDARAGGAPSSEPPGPAGEARAVSARWARKGTGRRGFAPRESQTGPHNAKTPPTPHTLRPGGPRARLPGGPASRDLLPGLGLSRE